ncbi:MAG: hypothetical protein JNL47_09530 [Bacteroidia bacterium]|nr:hypothetical protein [Bacteroidia bacterium]
MLNLKNTLIATGIMLIAFSQTVFSQDKDKKKDEVQIKMEAVQEKCKDIPFEKRVRVRVSRFNSTAGNSPKELGENMSTMLSNALSQVNCFQVLEEIRKLDDVTKETDLANSEYVDAGTGTEKGKLLQAQIVVTGEVTEYNDATSTSGTLGISSSTSKAKIGFILKVLSPKTGAILKSTSFNVEARKGSGSSFRFVGIKMSGKTSSNPAVAAALEKGIIQAVEYLAQEKDNIPMPSAEELNSNLTTVVVSNCSFSQKSNTLDMLKNTAGVKSAELAKFENNIATYSVRHHGSSDDLATVIDKKYAGRFEITDLKSGKISMKLK